MKKNNLKTLPLWLKVGITFATIDLLFILMMFIIMNLTDNLLFALILIFTQLIGGIVWFFLEPLNTSNNVFIGWITMIFSLLIGLLCWFLIGALIGKYYDKLKTIMQKIKN